MAFTTHDGKTRTTLSEINMVPFIDIVLVLLIIFMVTAPVIQSGVEVRVPKTEFVREISEERMIVSIKKDETVYLQGKPVNVLELAAKIREKNGNKSGLSVYVQADEDSHVGVLAQVMSRLKQGGIENISLVTEPLNEKVASEMIRPAERVEKFDRWLVASVALHVGIVAAAFFAPALFGAKAEPWGSKAGGNGGVNLKIVTSIPGIALPAPAPNADDTAPGKNQSIHKAEPEPKPKAPDKAEPADLKLPSKNAPKKTDIVAADKTIPSPASPSPPNAVAYGQGGGTPALRLGQTGTGPTGAEIGGDGTFGEKYGWYVDSMTRAIQNEWIKVPASSSARAPKVYITFTISRDGRVNNPQLDPPSGSGQPLLDNNALRAVRTAKLPALPPDYRGPDVSVRFYFDYAR